MKKLSLLLFSIIYLSTTAQVTELKLASDIWPPFTDVAEKKALASDLVAEALDEYFHLMAGRGNRCGSYF